MTQSSPSEMTPEKGRWRLSAVPPEDLLARLPEMGRVMCAVRQDGLLHERLGGITSLHRDGSRLVMSSEDEVLRLPYGLLDHAVLDISLEMRGQLYPRLEFHDAGGTHVLSVTGLAGPEPFLAPLGTPGRAAAAARPDPAPQTPPPEVPEDDPALRLLQRFLDSATPLRINAVQHGITQTWTGVVEKLMPMGGCVNIITKPFHLHLESGRIASWRTAGRHHSALDSQGTPLGLEIIET